MAQTLEHKVLYTSRFEITERELKFATSKNAIGFATPYVKSGLWTNVHFQQLADDGTWIEDKESQNILMGKIGNAKKETSMDAVPALIQLGELVGVLEKSAAKNKLTQEQQHELLTDGMKAFVASGISYARVHLALSEAFPNEPNNIPSDLNNQATEKVPTIQPMPQVAVTPRETPVENKPVERLHVQVPDKEAQRGGLFGRKS